MEDQIRERSPEGALSWDPEGDLRLLDAVLNGIHGLLPMRDHEKINWVRRYLPRTYGLLATSQHWAILTHKHEDIR